MPKTASTIGRCLALLLFAGLGLAAGLLEEQFISLWLVEPPSATDSEVVRARGYPHAWLVNEPQPPGVPELSRRIVNRQLLMSLFFWLAASTIALSALRAIWHRFSRRPLLSAPMGLRLFAAWSTAGCAATYGYLFTGMFSYWWLLIATVIGVTTPFVVVRSWGDSAIRWLGALIAILVAALTASADLAISSGSGSGIVVLLLIGVYLLASIAIALLLLSWLAPACRMGLGSLIESPGRRSPGSPKTGAFLPRISSSKEWRCTR